MESPQPEPAPLPAAAAPLEAERQRWNQALLDPQWRASRFNAAPNALLVEAVAGLPAGSALDINMGEGRNALYLAQQGWQVTGVDIADQALAFARQRAQELGVSISTHAQDLQTFDWGRGQWDLLVLCYADEQDHARQVAAALRPGGLVVFENFHRDVNQAWGEKLGREIGFTSSELRDRYVQAGFEIVRYEEPVAVADFTRETQRLVRLLARRR
ncbi:hypothetical protein GCM10023185_00460 [Hymenobacter saemangeumensis]|uniref:Methyltransferase domain-containing protein n=1 Tax=Hymenobacter saemangeumensis TaxID=1084522 RepID=A0ABP8HWL2_9BACT